MHYRCVGCMQHVGGRLGEVLSLSDGVGAVHMDELGLLM